MMHRNRESLGLALGLSAVVVFGGSLPATRAAVAGLDPLFATAARAGVATVIAVILLVAARRPLPRQHATRFALIGLTLVIGFPVLLALASQTVPSAHGGVVLGLLPLATATAAVFLAHERPSPSFWILTAIGSALVTVFALRDGDTELALGDLLLALAVTLTGVGYTLSGVLSRELPGWEVGAWALVASLPIVAPALVILWPQDASAVPLSSWIGVIYGGVMTQFVGYTLWNAALAIGSVARVGQLQLLQPFVTFVIAAVFLDEPIDAAMVAFAVAVAVVVALGRRAAVAAAPPPA